MMDRKTQIVNASKVYGGGSPMITKFFTLGAEWADKHPIVVPPPTRMEDEDGEMIEFLKRENAELVEEVNALKEEIEKLKAAKPRGGRGKKAAEVTPSAESETTENNETKED